MPPDVFRGDPRHINPRLSRLAVFAACHPVVISPVQGPASRYLSRLSRAVRFRVQSALELATDYPRTAPIDPASSAVRRFRTRRAIPPRSSSLNLGRAPHAGRFELLGVTPCTALRSPQGLRLPIWAKHSRVEFVTVATYPAGGWSLPLDCLGAPSSIRTSALPPSAGSLPYRANSPAERLETSGLRTRRDPRGPFGQSFPRRSGLPR